MRHEAILRLRRTSGDGLELISLLLKIFSEMDLFHTRVRLLVTLQAHNWTDNQQDWFPILAEQSYADPTQRAFQSQSKL